MITKIKFTGNNLDATQITIKNVEVETNKETKINSTLLRHADFTAAMRGLEPVLYEILPLHHEEARDALAVTGVTLTKNDEQGLGAVVTAKLNCEAFNTPLIINTPHLHEDKNDTGVQAMPWEMLEAIERLIEKAEMFLAGHRAQENLPFDEVKAGALAEAAEEFHENLAENGMKVSKVEDGVVHIDCGEQQEEPA